MTSRLKALDGVRAIAAISVLLFHTWGYTTGATSHSSGVTNDLFERTRWGLMVFFVLSGFLLYRPFLQAAKDGRPAHVGGYLMRRSVRIFPAYLCVVAVVASFSGRVRAPGQLVKNILLVHSFTLPISRWLVMPTWSLCVEAQFYIALPLLAAWATRRYPTRPFRPLFLLALLAAATRYAIGDGALRFTLLGYLIEFLPGMALAAAYVDRRRVDPRVAFTLAMLIVAAAAIPADTDPTPLWTEPLVALAVASLLAGVLLGGRETLPGRVLGSRPLVALGTISYGVFLWHSPILHMFNLSGGYLTMYTAILATFVLASVIAAASWFLLERPLLALVHRRREPAPAASPAVV